VQILYSIVFAILAFFSEFLYLVLVVLRAKTRFCTLKSFKNINVVVTPQALHTTLRQQPAIIETF